MPIIENDTTPFTVLRSVWVNSQTGSSDTLLDATSTAVVKGRNPTVGTQQAATILGCSRAEVYKLIRTGKLTGHTTGKLKRVYVDSIEAYQRGNEFGSKPAADPNPDLPLPVNPAAQAPIKPFVTLQPVEPHLGERPGFA